MDDYSTVIRVADKVSKAVDSANETFSKVAKGVSWSGTIRRTKKCIDSGVDIPSCVAAEAANRVVRTGVQAMGMAQIAAGTAAMAAPTGGVTQVLGTVAIANGTKMLIDAGEVGNTVSKKIQDINRPKDTKTKTKPSAPQFEMETVEIDGEKYMAIRSVPTRKMSRVPREPEIDDRIDDLAALCPAPIPNPIVPVLAPSPTTSAVSTKEKVVDHTSVASSIRRDPTLNPSEKSLKVSLPDRIDEADEYDSDELLEAAIVYFDRHRQEGMMIDPSRETQLGRRRFHVSEVAGAMAGAIEKYRHEEAEKVHELQLATRESHGKMIQYRKDMPEIEWETKFEVPEKFYSEAKTTYYEGEQRRYYLNEIFHGTVREKPPPPPPPGYRYGGTPSGRGGNGGGGFMVLLPIITIPLSGGCSIM